MGGATFWQATSAVVTTLGVIVALWIALRSEALRRAERDAEHLAEARMFRVRGQGGRGREPTPENPDGFEFIWYAEHHGPHPVFDVHYEAWPGGTDLKERPALATVREVVQPGENADTLATYGSTEQRFSLLAWRVRWRDRYGNEWVCDQRGQTTPRRFDPRDPPTAY